jgi:hypothetical protein
LAYGLGSTSGFQNNNGLIVSLVKPAAATSLTLTTSKTGESRMIPSSFRVYGNDGVSGDIDSGGWKLIFSSNTGFSGAQGESRGFFLDNTKTFSRYAIDFPTTMGTQSVVVNGVTTTHSTVRIAEVNFGFQTVTSSSSSGTQSVPTVIEPPGSSPAGQGVQFANDGRTDTKYLNLSGAGSGLILKASIVDPMRALTLTTRTSDDIWEWDPKAVAIFGSESAENPDWNAQWTFIAASATNLADGRGVSSTITFANSTAYPYYKVVFTDVKGTSGGKQYVHVSEVSMQARSYILDQVKATASVAGASDVLRVSDGMPVIVGGEGSDEIAAPQSTTKAIILGDLGQGGFNKDGILTALQIVAYDSADAYRIDGGVATATLKLAEDTTLWIGRDSSGKLLQTRVDGVAAVDISGTRLSIVFQGGFNHDTDRKESEDAVLFNAVFGKFVSVSGLFRNGDLTYDLVEETNVDLPESNVLRLKTIRIPGAGDHKIHIYVDSTSGQDEVGMGFTSYFFREPKSVGRVLVKIDGLAYLDGIFDFRESTNAADPSKDSWVFVSTDVEGGLRAGDNHKVFIGFRRGSGVTVVGGPGSTSGNGQVSNAVDGDLTTSYLNTRGPGSGLILSMPVATTVTSMTLTTRASDDIWEWDPSQYKLYGSNGDATPDWNSDVWVVIASGDTLLGDGRGATSTVTFTNGSAFQYYK